MSDIIDRIDELVADQMRNGEPRQGYDYGDPTYPKCPHCGRHWHGLRITKRIATMYAWGRFDENYSSQDDDSPVLCEGSEFIGPQRGVVAPQWTMEVGETILGHVTASIVPSFDFSGLTRAIQEMQAQFARITLWSGTFERTLWSGTFERIGTIDSLPWYLPPEPTPCTRDDGELAIEFGPQQWMHELLRPRLQFPRYRRTPLELDIANRWGEFTAPTHPLPEGRPIDFKALEDGMSAFANTGPPLPPLRTRGRA